jgi:uncharacterized protein (TIGR02452 family)
MYSDNIFVKRIDCWYDSLSISKQLKSPPNSIKVIYNTNLEYVHKYKNTNIKFFDMDSIECCLLHSPNALILNLADDIFPGGCVAQGSGAQEEALFRRTNYNMSLKQEFYPLLNGEAVYSDEISLIKTDEKTNWTLLDIDNLPKITFIACPGIKCPDTIIVNDEERLKNTDVESLKIQIRLIIQTAIKYNHDTIIFGALGCGAWKCPSTHVAQIFKEVLESYDGSILNYYFAILNTSDDKFRGNRNNDTRKTVDIFKNVFDQ